MGEHREVLGRPNMLRPNQLLQPVQQRLLVETPAKCVGSVRLILTHLVRAMVEWHDLPRKPADDDVDTVK